MKAKFAEGIGIAIAVAITLAMVAIGVLSTSHARASILTTTPHHAGVSVTVRKCTSYYTYADGVEGLLVVPYAKAKWTSNPCETDMQVSVHSGSSCTPFYSGVVHGTGIWDQASGVERTPYCSAWIRFKCDTSACTWHAWQRLKNTSAPVAHTLGIKIVKPGPNRRDPACNSTVEIFLTNSDPESWADGTGTGNPLEMDSTPPPSTWNVACVSGGVKFKTNNGNCIEEADTSHNSTVIDNPCDSSIARQVWKFFNQDYQGDWFNNWDGAVVYTYGTGGDKLRFTTGTPCGGQSGCWSNWAFNYQ